MTSVTAELFKTDESLLDPWKALKDVVNTSATFMEEDKKLNSRLQSILHQTQQQQTATLNL